MSYRSVPRCRPQRRVLPRERQAGDRAIERRLELGAVEGFAKVIVAPCRSALMAIGST